MSANFLPGHEWGQNSLWQDLKRTCAVGNSTGHPLVFPCRCATDGLQEIRSIWAKVGLVSIFPKHSDYRCVRSEEHTSELQSRGHLVCRLLLEKKKTILDRRDRMCHHRRYVKSVVRG